MGAESPRKRKQQPAWRAAAAGGDAPRGAQYKWKPDEAGTPGAWKRRAKQLFLVGGSLGCVAAIVWLILYLRPSPKATLIAVAANPAEDAERLDVPLDLYGWLTANRVVKLSQEQAERDSGQRWGRARAAVTSDGGPFALPADEQGLADWANRLKNADYDPLVLYVGLHGGTTAEGPFLFTGGRDEQNRPRRLPVAALVRTLTSEPLKAKKKVLILDPGRLPPDPVYGQLHDDFAARVRDDKTLAELVKSDGNLVVLCGADDGQRGWESEELQATAFGYAVLRALRGELPAGPSDVITAKALFAAARDKTEQWTRINRPAAQVPFLLPEGEEGLRRAEAIKVGVRPDSPPPAPPAAPALAADQLKDRWQRHDALADASPSPALYAPRTWRRYRKLLLRYEQAVRAGEPTTAERLRLALDSAGEAITRAAALPEFESQRNSIALYAALHGGAIPPSAGTPGNALPAAPGERAALADQALRLLASQGSNLLPTTAASLRRFAPDQRPIEAHLPVMVDQFYTGGPGQAGAAPAAWSAAFAAKRLAERAALGLPADEQLVDGDIWAERLTQYLRPQPLAERLWPVVREAVTAGDRLRREGEDRLFASASTEHATANARLTEAQAAYRKASDAASKVRTALLVRDLVFADLPFLTRWAGNRAASAAETDALVELWQAAHKLAAELEASPVRVDAIAATARDVARRFARLRGAFDADVSERKTSDAALQGEWWRKQQVLATPLIRAQDRAELLAASRRASGLLAGSDKPPGEIASADAGKTDAKGAARARGRLAWATLGERLLDAQYADGERPKAAFVEKDLNDLKELPANDPAHWAALANKVGAGLARHFAELSSPGKTDARAEWFSRVAVRFDRDDGWEPAAVNLRLRWRALLDGLAERVADDHWYDEQYDPASVANAASAVGKFYRRAADRYLTDAGRVAAGLPGVAAFAVRPELAAKLNAAPLEGGALPRVTWTSERTRVVAFAPHALPAAYPITGHAVWLPQLGKIEPLRPEAAPDRPLRPLRGDAPPLAIKLALDPRVDTVVAQRSVAATLYFRGQRPTLTQQIELRRRPDLVISDPLPGENEKGAMVAVRADKALDLGTVAILIDYSGSMKGDLETNKDLSDWKTNANSKFNIALNALEAALKELPEKTPLRVRVFSDKQDAAMQSRPVFTADRWDAADDLPKLMRRLRGLTPEYFTPLIESIKSTAANEFPSGRDKIKTLIVLTDGADEEAADATAPPGARLKRILKNRGGMYDTLNEQGVQLFVVQVGLNGEDLELSKALFGDLPGKTPPGRVWTAAGVKQLQLALQDAIHPKLELSRGGEVPRGFPREGWPSRTTDSRAGLYWSPLVPEGRYEALPSPGRRGPRTDLLLNDGDRLILGLVRDPVTGGIRVRRELAAGFPDLRELARQRKDKRWVALAPRNYVDDQHAEPQYRATVFLDQVPPHLRTPGTFESTLQHARPTLPGALLWWDAAPAQSDATPPGTLRVRKRYNYWAPAWDVTADNWRKTPAGYPQAQLRVWVAETPPEPLPQPPDGYELNQRYTVRSPGGNLDVRLSYEPQPLLTNAKGEEVEVGCLVVRVTYPAGQPVLAKLENSARHHARHSYYRYHCPDAPTKKDGQPGEYTAIFGPFEQAELAAAKIRLSLTPVAAALRDENAITLTPPRPETTVPVELDYQPQPARAAENP